MTYMSPFFRYWSNSLWNNYQSFEKLSICIARSFVPDIRRKIDNTIEETII